MAGGDSSLSVLTSRSGSLSLRRERVRKTSPVLIMAALRDPALQRDVTRPMTERALCGEPTKLVSVREALKPSAE